MREENGKRMISLKKFFPLFVSTNKSEKRAKLYYSSGILINN